MLNLGKHGGEMLVFSANESKTLNDQEISQFNSALTRAVLADQLSVKDSVVQDKASTKTVKETVPKKKTTKKKATKKTTKVIKSNDD